MCFDPIVFAICPVCNGTKKVDGKPCQNCGGQVQFGSPSGIVHRRPDGVPCVHEYKPYPTIIRTIEYMQCVYCPHSYSTDSGD